MTEEKSHSLDNGHHRKHDTYGSRRLGIYFTHKKDVTSMLMMVGTANDVISRGTGAVVKWT